MDIYYDASDCIVGRLASVTAKQLLKGKSVYIVNAEKALVTGNPKHNVKRYKEKVDRGDPYHGPFYPKYPDQIIKRQIRGMLPKSPKGRDAFKRLRVYLATPTELAEKQFTKPEFAARRPIGKFMELGVLSVKIGAKKTWDIQAPAEKPAEERSQEEPPKEQSEEQPKTEDDKPSAEKVIEDDKPSAEKVIEDDKRKTQAGTEAKA